MTDMTTIALDRLERHPDNVRKTTATGIAELAASIERDGLLQNLTVVDGTYNKGKHWVIAGARRLAALQLLAKAKKLPADFPVPVRVIDPADAEGVSLAENQMREQMHPIDQFIAFKAQVDANHPIADVAARFGVTETFVKQRMKLAAVSPALLEVYRAGKMTLEQLQAFTVTDDHARQVEVWEDVKGSSWRNDADSIKEELLDSAVSAKDVRLKFVGLQAYQKAGGAIIAADLFASEDDVAETVSDPELLERLALEKLQKRAAKLQKDEGLAWCDARVTATWHIMRENYGTVPTILRDMTEAEAKLHAELDAKLNVLQKQLDEVQEADEFDDDLEEKLIAEMDELEPQRDAIDEACTMPHPDALEYAGAVVSIDDKGKVEITRNLIRQADMKHLKPVDMPKQQGIADDDNDDDEPAPTSSHSEKLIRRLTAYKTGILRGLMMPHNGNLGNEMALVVTVFHMLAEDLMDDAASLDPCLTMHTRPLNKLERLADDIGDLPAVQRSDSLNGSLTEPLRVALANTDDAQQALWDYLRALPVDSLLIMLSVCVAKRLDVVAGHEGDGGHSGFIANRMLSDSYVATQWKPTRANYFDHVSKAQIVEVVRQNSGDERAAFVAKLSKPEAAERAEELMQNKNWLPSPMRVKS
jgi:ParB family chromosome partitioning protein